MNKVRVQIRSKEEPKGESNKLAFTPRAQEEARKRIHQPSHRGEVLRTITTEMEQSEKDEKEIFRKTIHQKLFPEYAEAMDRTVYMGNQIEIINDEEIFEKDSKTEVEPKSSELNFHQYPFFPGIYPTIHQPDDPFYEEKRAWRPPTVAKEQEPEEEYLDLGPIYEEKEEREDRSFLKRIQVKPNRNRMAQPNLTSKKRLFNEQRRYWVKLVFSILGAIGLGTLFGYLMLMLILSPDAQIPNETPTEQMSATGGEQTDAPLTDQREQDPTLIGNVKNGYLTIADRTYYAIQAGVYTEKEKGDLAVTAFNQKDYSTLLFNDDVYRIFLGIAYKKEDAANLSQYYKTHGTTDLYLKEYTIRGGEIHLNKVNDAQLETLNKFLTHGTYLLDKTSAWAGDGVTNQVNITPEQWTKYKETHQLFLQEGEQTKQFLYDEQKRWVTQMSSSINQAATSLSDYINKNDAASLVKSQQGLLGFFEGYRELLLSAGVDVSVQ